MSSVRERSGLVFAALCALNGAFVPAVAKLTTNGAEPFFVATSAAVFAGMTAAVVLAVRRELPLLVESRTLLGLIAVGVLGTAGAFSLFFWGARRASAIETVLCLQIEPAYSLLLAWIFLGHAPTLRRVLATLVLLAGIALAVGGRIGLSPGVLVLLAAPLCWQVSHLIVLRRLVGVAPLVLTAARYVYGGAALGILWWLRGASIEAENREALVRLLPLLAAQGVILSYAGTWLWYQAVTRLDLARTTAIVVPSTPLLSLLASFVLLGEIPTVPQALGLLMTAAGVGVFVTAPAAGIASLIQTKSDGAPVLSAGDAGTVRD